jgi:hypothetical protein
VAHILQFNRENNDGPARIDAGRLWDYVRPRLDFPLPDFMAHEIDEVLRRQWAASESEVDFHECVRALESLQGKDILIPIARRELIVSLVFEHLERHGFLYRKE